MTSRLQELLQFAQRSYPAHRRIYLPATLLAVALMILVDQWWLFWPLAAWTFVFAVQFLTVKSLDVDSEWIDERIARTADKAYDFDHIEDIRSRYEDAWSKPGAPDKEPKDDPRSDKAKPES